MAEPTEAELVAYEIWKNKHPGGGMILAKRRDLREFREKFGTDTASNFHCPWCFTGRLYFIEDLAVSDLYVCRSCELQFSLTCHSQPELDKMVADKKEERKIRREEHRRGNKETELINTLTVEALHFKEITCQGCGKTLLPELEHCSCGWKNPLVGLGD